MKVDEITEILTDLGHDHVNKPGVISQLNTLAEAVVKGNERIKVLEDLAAVRLETILDLRANIGRWVERTDSLREQAHALIDQDELHKRQRDQLLQAVYDLRGCLVIGEELDRILLEDVEGAILDIDNGGVFFETIEEGGE